MANKLVGSAGRLQGGYHSLSEALSAERTGFSLCGDAEEKPLREAKFHVVIKPVERGLPTSKEAMESLKGLGGKTISRMRREAVDCPVRARPTPFIECFACSGFIRRAHGIVDCEGLPRKAEP